MAARQSNTTVTPRVEVNGLGWMFFVGLLLLLMGMYGALRIVHISRRGVPYPYTGVMPNNLLFDKAPVFYSRESDCQAYPQVYYDYSPDGKQTPRQVTEEERTTALQLEERCIKGFNEDRQKILQYDRNLSAFLIFVGGGLVLGSRLGRRYFTV